MRSGVRSVRHPGLLLAALCMLSSVWVSAPNPLRALEAGSSRCVTVPGAAPGDLAIVNITNTGAVGRGYGALRSSDATPVPTRPPTERFSSVNFASGQPVNPNLAVSAIGSDGRICYDGAESSHDVILDLAGVISASGVIASDPVRLVDTRTGARVGADSTICTETVDAASAGDVAIVNITPLRAAGRGFGSLRADDDTAPVFGRPAREQFSSVNFAADTPPNPNLAAVVLGPGGRFCYDGAVADHDVVLDLTAVLSAAAIIPAPPQRFVDTRGDDRVIPDSSVCADLDTGETDALVFVNVTNTQPAGRGYGLLRSSDDRAIFTRPTDDRRSSVNFAVGTPPNPNLAVASIGTDGAVCYDGVGAVHDVLLDRFAIVSSAHAVDVEPTRLLDTRPFSTTCTPFADMRSVSAEVTGALRRFSDDEFQRLVDLTSTAGIISSSSPPILGDPVADARIRFIAEQRGYRRRNDVGGGAVVAVPGGSLTPAAAAAWSSLVADGRRSGVSLILASAYRSTVRQRAIFTGKLAAAGHNAASVRAGRADAAIDGILRFSSIPGYSRHHTGVVVDILSPGFGLSTFDRSAAYRWLSADNFLAAKQHGFVPSYPATAGLQGPGPEPWEFVHVGTDALRTTAAFGSVTSIAAAGGEVVVTGTFVDPDQTIELYDDDALVMRALARCVRLAEPLAADTGFRLSAAVANPGDLCVVVQLPIGARRLVACNR